MTTDNSDDEFESISKTSHAKISEKMEKMGYKDGVHDGRESQFQAGFDDGYEQGFQNGFLLGKFKGSLSAEQSIGEDTKDSTVSNDLILQRPSRGQCILCTNPTLKDASIKDIVENQTEHMIRVESTLKERYEPLE